MTDLFDLFVVEGTPKPEVGARSTPDWRERELALDIRQSWIVEAPAGSGKTGLLIQRYLKLLAEESVTQPEQVLAITFTNKATAEMRERVIVELDAARLRGALKRGDAFEVETRRLAEAVVERDAALGWELVENPQRLAMRTIDSVCSLVASSLPVLSGSGGGQNPVMAAAGLYRTAARRTLLQLGGADAALNAALRTVMLHRDGNLADCERLLMEMLALRDQWGRLVPLREQELDDAYLDGVVLPMLERALDVAICEGLTRLRQRMPDTFLSELAMLAGDMGYADGYDGELSPIAFCAGVHTAPEATAEHLEHWRALTHLLTTKGPVWRAKAQRNFLNFEIEKGHAQQLMLLVDQLRDRDDVLEAIKELRRLPPATYPAEQWQVAKALFRVLQRALVELKLVFAERGECDFAEVSLQAKEALEAEGGVSDLGIALGMELRHLLVDEMQDTSTSQYELIRLLTQGWDGQSQTVFLVGDPKQSIYLFRQARVERFVRTMETELLGDLPVGLLRLTANFRSQRGLVEKFNEDFSLLFPHEASEGEVEYVPAAAVRGGSASESVVWHCEALPSGLKGEELTAAKRAQRKAEATEVRRVVEDWRARPLPEGRSEPWKIAVLVQGRKHLVDIVAAFKRGEGNGTIPFRAVKIDALRERQEVLDLTGLTRALLHPADRVAWLAVLHAPWCGLGLADLHRLTGADDPQFAEKTVEELMEEHGHLLSEDGCARLTRLWPVMRAAAMQRGRLTTSQWVERTWRSLGADAYLSDDEIANARRYLKLLDEIEAEMGAVDLEVLQERLEDLYAETTAVPGAVDLMTIHGAKGLEWDVVLVPGMERPGQTSRSGLLTWDEVDSEDEEAARVVLAPIAGKGEESGELNVWLSGIHSARERAERKRLFYVVCTRAREELHLFASPSLSVKGEVIRPAGSLLKAAWPAAERHFVGASNVVTMAVREVGILEQVAAVGLEEETVPVLKRLPQGFDVAARWAGVKRLVYGVAGAEVEGGRFERPEGSFTARSFGNAMHAFLEVLTKRLAEGATVGELLREVPRWKGRVEGVLRGDGLPPAMVERQAQRVIAGLVGALADPDGAWILGVREDAASEFALVSWDESRRSVRLDRVFRGGAEPGAGGSDCLWIVDYKTTELGGRSAEEFVSAERLKYGPQLEAYARVMAAEAGPLGLRLGLYYPMLPRLIWWTPGS